LRLAWARHQQAAGRAIWSTPEILTWDAWLTRQWRAAVLRGATPAQQLLTPSQERMLWESALQDAEEGEMLGVHAPGLVRAASRATQSLLVLSRGAVSEEEHLLVRALQRVRQQCGKHGLLSLRLAPAESLQFLRDTPPPLVAGEQRLTALQQALQQQCWGAASLLLAEPLEQPATPVLRGFASLAHELAGCAQWCLARLRADSRARLLVLSACAEPSLAIQGELLWRYIDSTGDAPHDLRQRLLAVEGGVPLHQLGLCGDALLALDCLQPELDTTKLFALLRSPYFQFGSQQELWTLQGSIEKWALARWQAGDLRQALASIADSNPAAARLLAWLELLRAQAPRNPRSASDWARCCSDALSAAGFPGPALDSREQQGFGRWNQLLDEFAALDAVSPPLGATAAVDRLRQLAMASRHQAASGDAAITLSSALADPVCNYDGIWVLGLAESRWPAPPRPDAYVPLREQREHHWPEADVAERRSQALWALSRWQQRTRELVLSYPQTDGDIQHRPTALPGYPAAAWQHSEYAGTPVALGNSMPARDQQFPALVDAGLVRPLTGGERRLGMQRDCPFRAQAQWRLGAHPPDPLSDGITALQRGNLLHVLLQGLWDELQDQAHLLQLTPQAERALVAKHWSLVVDSGAISAARWWPAGLRERERERTLDVITSILRVERARASFAVQDRELKLQWPDHGARLNLRIDRVDRMLDGSQVLIDYKSGAVGSVKLQDGELEPLQLALYVAALAARGRPVTTAALFGLKPGNQRLAGVSAGSTAPTGFKPIADWDALVAQWREQLLQLLADHLSGSGQLARSPDACRHCHLPALCRRAAIEEMEDEEGADE